MQDGIDQMQHNEPETLKFSIYEQQSDQGTKLALFERLVIFQILITESLHDLMHGRYTSWEAVKKHESSDNYQNMFKIMNSESLLDGPPEIVKGNFCFGLKR